MAMTRRADAADDRKRGIKPGSPEDKKLDKARGIKPMASKATRKPKSGKKSGVLNSGQY